MIQPTQVPEITHKQRKFITDLAAQRAGWIDILTGPDFETVADVLVNAQIERDAEVGGFTPGCLKKILCADASRAIDALLRIRPTLPLTSHTPAPVAAHVVAGPAHPTPLDRLQTLLGVVPVSRSVRFAVEVNGVLRFYAVDLRRDRSGNQRRWVRQLLGAPGSWNRKILSVDEQLRVARLIAEDWEKAALLYATEHGHCSRCDAYLSDERSRAAKVGWKCAKEWGWTW